MQKQLLLTLMLLLFWFAASAQVSTSCAGSTPSTIAPPSNQVVCSGTVSPVVTPSSNPPNLEYVITDPNTTADDYNDATPPVAQMLGPVILGTSVSSTIDPASYGITAGMTFEVTAVNYDLAQIQGLIDDLYNNNTGFPFFIPCCTAAGIQYPGLCSDLMNAGINSGADIMNLNDALVVFDQLNPVPGSTISIEGMIGLINDVNNAGLPGPCGGNRTPLCYAIDQTNTATYFYRPIPSIDLIEDGCPVNPDLITVTASIPSGTLEYSLDGSTYQSSNQLIATGNPVTVYVRESTCGEVSSEAYTISCALPVELLSFEGKNIDGRHHINWTTADETNFDRFELQQSDQPAAFKTIAQMDGLGQTGFGESYQYVADPVKAAWNYYRLRMVDLDGSEQFSPVLSLKSDQSISNIDIHPNPVTDQLRLQLDLEQNTLVNIYDNTGRILNAIPLSAGDEFFQTAFPYPSGVYWLQWETNGETGTKKFVKM